MHSSTRLVTAAVIGLLAAALCAHYQTRFGRGAGDIAMPLCMGEALLRGVDPYSECRGFQSDGVTPNTTNPITTALVVFPLLPLPRATAAGVFFGLSSALLAWALTREGQAWRLLTFLAFPYWAALQTVQWSPLLLAGFFWPVLLAVTLAKPHVGAAAALCVPWRPRPVAVAVMLGLVSLAVVPAWPLRMLGGVGAPGEYLPPVLVFPGTLLLLAALRWREREGRLLLLLGLAPQRIFYDQLLAFGVPRTPRDLLLLVTASWLCYLCAYMLPQLHVPWATLLIYLPALGIVLAGSARGAPARPATPATRGA